MSVLEHPEMQIWNNAVFDNGESEDPAFVKAPWPSSSTPMSTKLSDSLRSDDSCKENLSPEFETSSKEMGFDSERNIDVEIEEIEKEISRLSSKLRSLRLKKAEKNAKMLETERPRGRVIPAKFMDQKVLQKEEETPERKVEDPSCGGKAKSYRRGVSLCPTEIYSTVMKSRPSINRPEIKAISPGLPLQSRRKSCFWKLNEIDELKVTKERRKSMVSMSLSPNAGKNAPKVQSQKQALTTIGSKKGAKKEDSVISSIQPRKLFKDGEKEKNKDKDRLVTTRVKGVKPGRVVASRYNQLTVSAARKRSFPENEKEESERVDKRRNSNVAGKVKKRWEIFPGDVVVYGSTEEEQEVEKEEEEKKGEAAESPSTVGRVAGGLRRIRAVRGVNGESPRDSGAVKRVAELEGRRRGGGYFGEDEEEEGVGFCQALSFIDDAEDEQVLQF